MTAPPVVSAPAGELYDALGAGFTAEDELTGWLTLLFCDAAMVPFERVWDLVVERGWDALFDVDRCPAWALPWLAQVVGARLIPGLDEDGIRLTIRNINTATRATPVALVAAARRLLTGNRSIKIDERYGGNARAVRVRTYDIETPNPAAVATAIEDELPSFLELTYAVFAGATYQEVRDSGMTYAQVRDAFPTYDDLRTWIPPEEPV